MRILSKVKEGPRRFEKEELSTLLCKISVIEKKKKPSDAKNILVQKVMSSPNHPTSDIEDAFSFNFSDYFPASPGNTSSESSNNSSGLVPIASPTLSLFHNNPYMKVMQAYDAISPLQVTIPPLTVMPPSPVLSLPPMFDS
ncbi:hypothetical protein Tco_0825095 [Tanacetum coccineum]